MAVPNNYIDKIKKDGDSRMISPAADMVRVDNDNFEGTDLDEVLDEVAQAIEEAGEGGYAPPAGGIPKTDLASDVQTSLGKADTALQSFTETDPTVPSWAKQPTKPTYTAQEVGALPANTTIPTKTSDLDNDSGFVTRSTMNTALAGKQDTLTFDNAPTANSNNPVKSGGIKTAIDAATPSIDPTTKKWVVGGQLTNVVAEGQDGQDGNSGVASADGVESVNNLNGGTTDTSSKVYVLGANQGKRLRDQIEYVYSRLQAVYAALGNIAFWDGKTPIANILPELDWGNPKHTVTLALSLTHAVAKHNGVAKSNGDTILVEEGGTLTLIVEPADGYALTSVTSSTTGATVTDLGNGTYSVAIAMGGSDMTLNVSASAVATIPITYGTMTNCSASSSNPSGVVSGGTVNLHFVANEDYGIKASGITISGASVGTITHSGQVYTIPITHDGTSQSVSIAVAASEAIPYVEPEGGELLHWWDGMTIQSGDTAWVDRVSHISVPKASTNDAETTPDPTNHCWVFNSSYNTKPHGLVIRNSSLDDIDADDCTIEVVYKAKFDGSFNRANVCVFHRREPSGTYGVPGGIYFCSKNGTSATDAFICGCNAGDVNDGTWDNSNVNDEICCIGMNNDDAVKNGSALALKTGTNATGHVESTGSTAGEGAICIGCYSNNSNIYSVFKGNIYAIRIYRGHLTAAQMLANQKVDNVRYNLGLTLPDSVQ